MTSSSAAPPSSRPSVNAKPELVVARAGKPSDSSTRAEPTSQGFGITNGAPRWSAANRSACIDTEDDLATFAAAHAALVRRLKLREPEDGVDLRLQDSLVGEPRQLRQLRPSRLDDEVEAVSSVGHNSDVPHGVGRTLVAGGVEDEVGRAAVHDLRACPARELGR